MVNTRWFSMPNDLSADSYVDLVADPDGPAHLGVWTGILMVASRTKPRGILVKEDGSPHDAKSLARVIRQPEDVVQTAIDRLLKIGLLGFDTGKPRKKSTLQSHPPAGDSQAPAKNTHQSAAEGEGKEHHHQEGKGTKKENEEKRTEPEGTEGASAFLPENSGKAPGKNPSQRGPDDEENPPEVYASPEDELKAIYLAKTGESITLDLLTAIRGDLELSGVSIGAFLAEVKKHSANKWLNPAGFLRDRAKRFRAKTRQASAPVTAAEAAEQNYKCPLCFSRIRGEGIRLVDRKAAPCECASAEYIARQTALGTFGEDPQ